MSSQNKKQVSELFFFNVIIKEKYLLINILIIFSLLSFALTFAQKKSFQEYQSQVVIRMATSDVFSVLNYYDNSQQQNDKSLEKFNSDFILNLTSLINLNNFLNQPNNSKYLQVLKKNKLEVRNYFKNGNFVIIKNDNFFVNNSLVKIFVMSYPSDFNFTDFFRDYMSFTSANTAKEFINQKLNHSNNNLILLEKVYDLNKKFNKLNETDKLSETQSFSKSFEEQSFFSKNLKYEGDILIYLHMSNTEVAKRIEFIKEANKIISNFNFQPSYEISEAEIFNNLSYNKNIFISLILSFITFFFIVIFKEFFKKYLI